MAPALACEFGVGTPDVDGHNRVRRDGDGRGGVRDLRDRAGEQRHLVDDERAGRAGDNLVTVADGSRPNERDRRRRGERVAPGIERAVRRLALDKMIDVAQGLGAACAGSAPVRCRRRMLSI